ncbi:serine hydrolase domain-containing protein [Anaerococcus tetradius]|uniref:serine hydrolase domain-containing protein n=1 Tax=Anaerococcus tetradius TaxID=33036 RepID=UPI0023F1711A|nr:serine hydrolase [Anaerococcus tetradius]
MTLNLSEYYKDYLKNSKATSFIIYNNADNTITGNINDIKVNIRSVAKTIMTLTAFKLMEDTSFDINLDTKIYPYIYKKIKLTNKKNLKYLEEIKLDNLLTHSIGYAYPLLMTRDIKGMDEDGLLNYAINYPISYQPTNKFLYSNVGFYLLSVFMESILETSLYEYIDRNFFKVLSIETPRWDSYGSYLVGASKLYLSSVDMLKFGEIILNKGLYKGLRILNKESIEKMLEISYTNSNSSRLNYLSEDYYCRGIWLSKENIIFASGSGGQIIAILEDEDIIIVANNGNDEAYSKNIKLDVDKLIGKIKEV